MGSSTDGLMAAQGAPEAEPDPRRSAGLFSRLFRRTATDGVDGGTPSHHAPTATATAGHPPHISLPGLSNLRRLRVDDVAVPKVDIVAVPVTIGRDELAEVFREHGFSRLPVYKGSLDHPLGVVTLKDLALTYGFGAGNGRFSLRKLLRPLLYAPPSMPLTVLLQKMQTERVHMALVIDEYGGVDGLVTIEDLLETVVGDISDEHDTEESALWAEEKPGVWLIQAMAPLDEVEAAIGQRLRVSDEDQDIDTLGGLVYLRAGRVPARGEVVPHENGAQIEVVDAEPRRIKRLRLRLPSATHLPVQEAEIAG
ncbi:magnesium and cobalt transporter [Gemmobacter megaterium]|uniref:Magnesium and cobalt transporter n=1 Tax=Gemmobacter megaterium TaxID=1086013 RepID=A0A1N7QHW8_9RHOB|nr:hemolysin family protein [Gemmobacter megaterium]SIT22472.1 magnesium and cobalt transporter [Gemmobacter megaterium]